MKEDFDFEIFEGKQFKDLLKDIYDKSNERDRRISILIDELRPLVKNLADAAMIIPLIKEYLDIEVRSDEQLVKMAAVIVRIFAANKIGNLKNPSNSNNPLGLTEEEIKELKDSVKKEFKDVDEDLKLDDVVEKTKKVLKKTSKKLSGE